MNSGIGLSYGGNIVFRNTAGNTVISSYGSEGMIYFRPNGDTSDVGVIQINKQGHLNGVSAGFTGGVSAARLTANEYIQIGDAQLVYDSANKALRVKHRADGNTVGFYSDGWVSALGVKTGGSGGGSGVVNTVYSFANLTDGTTFSDSDLDNTFNAYTINEIWKMAKEGGGIKNITQSGSGNAVTNMALSSDGKTITAVFGETFARQQDLGTLNNTVTQLSNKLNNFLEGSDADNIINKWKELEAFLDGFTESDNLAELLALKADKTITISAGTGLTGGGNLSANRTLSLATTGVNAGTYTKVTVDTYGRVTVGNNPTTLAGYGITDAYTKTEADGKYVTIATPQTITGQKTFTQNILFSNNITGIRNTAGNLVFGAGNENIFCILNDYVGPVEAKNNQLVLGNDVGYWKKVTAGQYISKVATGVSPLIVSSNTLVNNLNADLLDGYHQSEFLRTDGVNRHVTLTRGSGNTEGYRLVLEATVPGGWSVNGMTLLVNSRHSGTGIISLVFHTTNEESTSYDGSLNYYGSTTRYGGITMWRLFYNTTTKKIRLFWHYYDYDDCQVSILNRRGVTTNISDGTWYTTLPSDNGNELPSYYNRSDSASSLATSCTLWGQPFNGTANVSGNMTGVGSINMSGQLTSTVASGTAPFIVASNTVVGNLNADLLDGLHAERFLLSVGRSDGTFDLNTYSERAIKEIRTTEQTTNNAPFAGYGLLANLWDSNKFAALQIGGTSTDLFFRGKHDGTNKITSAWHRLLHTENYASIADGRYVKKAGDTMTGDLNISGGHILYMLQTSSTSTQQIHFQGGKNDYGRIASGGTAENAGWMEIASCDDGNEPIYARQYTGLFTTVKNTLTLLDANGDTVMSNNKGLSVGWGSRQVREGGSWVHGGADAANSDDANLRFGSWMGIGWYPTISGQTVAQGKNAMWLNTRTGVLNVVGGIKESTICIGRVNSSGGYDTAYNGEINRYDHHLFLQHHSGKYLIMCTGGGLAGIGTNSPGEKLHVAGNTRTDGYFKSTVGTGTQPYQCSSTTLNTNLNADLFDNWHLNFFPRNYNNNRTYAVQFALGGTDNGWKKIFACSESGTGPWRSVTVWGQIWYAYGSHAQEEVRHYHFCAIFQMRSGETSSGSNVGSVVNSARLYLPTFAKGMDNIRLVRVGTNNFELQVRQISSYNNGHIQYQYWDNGANVSAWENLQSTSNTSVAVSAGGASTLADNRASSADVLTTSRTLWGRPFNGSANIDGNIDNAAVITSKGGIRLDLKGSSGVAFYAGGSLCAVMNTTGVGIGTSSPSQKLHVEGNIIATGAITAKASSSDIRLKTDIQGYDAMGIIRKFRSVKYHWNNLAKRNSEIFNHKKWNYGLIAQDLLSGGYSQWVSDIFKDYYTIDYERLIPVVWKGLQEVDDEVTRLKKRVKELEKRLGINN